MTTDHIITDPAFDGWWLRKALHAELDRKIMHLADWEVDRVLLICEMVRKEYADVVDVIAMSTVALAVALSDLLVLGPDVAEQYLAALRADLEVEKARYAR